MNTSPQLLREYVYHYSNRNAEFYIHTEIVYPENPYQGDEDGVVVDAKCEIQLHASGLPLMSHEGVFQSEQVCFDVLDMC